MILKENVTRNLRNAIIMGEYKLGERLPEIPLCRQFNVSRTPIREALQQLEKEGLVKINPNVGASVVELTRKDVSDIYDMLIILEGAACRLSCSQITADHLNKLEEYQFIMEKSAANNNFALFFQVNVQFHWLITESTKNTYLIEVRGNFRRLVSLFARLSPNVPGQVNATLQEHPRIIDAIKKSNAGLAEFLAREHLENAKRFMLSYLQEMSLV